jgi:hypothetical protein
MRGELGGRQMEVPAVARAVMTRRLVTSKKVLRGSAQVCLEVIEPEI